MKPFQAKNILVRLTLTTLIVGVLVTSFGGLVFAQEEEPYKGEGIVPCTGAKGDECDFEQLVALGRRIITWLLFVAVFIAMVLFAYAGFLYMSSGGDEGKVKKAHDIFRKVIIGFIIALAAWLIVYTITSTLLSDEFKNVPLLDEV